MKTLLQLLIFGVTIMIFLGVLLDTLRRPFTLENILYLAVVFVVALFMINLVFRFLSWRRK